MEQQKINYNFVDNIRALAMISIVIEHSSLFWSVRFDNFGETFLQTFTIQSFKFGTIIFFILAGFLIGDKLSQYSSLQYIKRRISNTFKPWLFWVFVLLFFNFLQQFLRFLKKNPISSYEINLEAVWLEINHVVFYTSFWFIINFIICIVVLLIFRKVLYSFWLGLAFLLLSLFYAVNLYYAIIPTEHTTAIFGFVFYLWIGVQLKRHYTEFDKCVKKINGYWLLILVTLTLAFAISESIYLIDNGSKDPFNTLRISNILYSIVVFVGLYKLKSLNYLEVLKPRQTTFGIYLVHQIIIFHLIPIIFRISGVNQDVESANSLLFIQIIRFVIAYFGSLLVVSLIDKSKKIRWIIGN